MTATVVTATALATTALATAVRAAPSAAAPEPAPAHWSARRRRAARVRFPARAPAADWPGTHEPAPAVAARLAAPPFTLPSARCQHRRARGVGLALDWLADQSGASWQQRWQAGGADPLGAGWRAVPNGWLAARGAGTADRTRALCLAVTLLVGADVLRPSLPWLVATAGGGRGALVPLLAATRDPDGFARLAAHCAAQPGVSAAATRHMLHRAAMILAAKGGPMAEITVGDVLELFDVEAQVNAREAHGAGVFYRMLRGVGMLGEQAPATLAQLRTDGPATPGQLIDRYRLACRPVRDLLVDYLSERAPALDYNSLRSLARFLGSVFWADLERHHPGIDSLHLPTDVATAWKRRLRTATTTPRAAGGAAGGAAAAPATRVGYRECLTPVRAFYLDLACWAGEDPARWARWVAPCPIGAEEIHRRKAVLARKARMDARTRARLPALPALLDILSRQRAEAALALATARATPPGQTCPVGAQVLRRCQLRAPREATVWVDELATGRRRDLALEEDHAFWVWAAVEVLRSTGVRIEELLELGHHALISYRLPTTGEVVPLLQIVPSKTDAERLLLVSPELADVLAAVLHRIRDAAGVVPLVARYDAYECVWSAPAPLLFQRRVGSEPRAMTMSGPAPDARRHPGPHRPGRPGDRRPAALHPARLPADVPHRRDRLGAAPAHRPGDRRPPGPQRHPGLQGGLPDRGDPGPPGVPRPPSSPAAQRGVPHAHRRRVAGVPRPLRAAHGFHRHLRPRVRYPLPARTRLHLLPGAAPGPPPAPPARRDPRQPARPHRRGRTGRLARRGRRAAGQPRRRPGQALPARPAPSRGWSRRAGNAAAARCRPVVSPPDPGQHQTRSGTYLALWPVDPDASWPAAHAAALDDLTRLTALAGVVLVGPPTFTCCEPSGWSGPLGTPGDLLLVAVAAVRAAAADERTPAPTGSPSAQYLPADVTVRERGVGERAARLEALTRLLRTGLTTEAIAVRTGLSTRTLDRLRVAVDNPSP